MIYMRMRPGQGLPLKQSATGYLVPTASTGKISNSADVHYLITHGFAVIRRESCVQQAQACTRSFASSNSAVTSLYK
jgi:hypothetical protein